MNSSSVCNTRSYKMPYLVKEPVAKSVTAGPLKLERSVRQSGFSLIELLIVVTVIGVIAMLAVPHLQKGIWAAQSGSTIATMRTISSTQVSYYAHNGRFGRLEELNNILGGALGTPSGNEIYRGKFVLAMVPASPADSDLRENYTITATRNIPGEGLTYVYELTQTGEIRQIVP